MRRQGLGETYDSLDGEEKVGDSPAGGDPALPV